MSERESVGIRLGLVAAFVVAFAACSPPPAWEPGDAPLAIYAPDDAAWEAMAAGCAKWSMTGLTCRRASYGEDAAVRVKIGIPDRPAAAAQTKYHPETARDMSPRWGYFVTLKRLDSAGHEIGHLLGIWEHLEEPGTLMHWRDQSPVPTDLDLDALSEAWGVAPWEDAE